MELFIKSVYPKTEKTSGKLIGYSLTFTNESGSYVANDFYSVEDMKNVYGTVSEKDCLDLKGKKVLETRSYKLLKKE